MLRDHVLFQKPLPIDIKKTTTIDTPDDFKDEIKDAKIEVLPLARDPKAKRTPGWCTYTYEHGGAPELEVICGGVNSKTPRAGAVWRQGHLLHFGFDLAPAEMNDTGRALLVNAVAYIARFTDDRPIVRTPCVFVQGKRMVDRDYLARRLREPKPDLSGLPHFFAKADFEKHLKDKSVEDVAAWYRKERDYLHADADGKLTVDADARAFGVPPAGPEFLGKASAALGRSARGGCPASPGPLRAGRPWRDRVRRGLVGVGREEPGVPVLQRHRRLPLVPRPAGPAPRHPDRGPTRPRACHAARERRKTAEA